MAINKKLIHFNHKEKFNSELANGNILPTSIVFIKDSKEIWTHGQYYHCPYNKEYLDNSFEDLESLISELESNKVSKEEGKGLSSNDYTDEEKNKLYYIEEGAEKNVVFSVNNRVGNIQLTKDDVNLNNVDNTSDLNKPISNATQDALDNKVDKIDGKQLSSCDFTQSEKDLLVILSKLNKPLDYKGSVNEYSQLPNDAKAGDVWNVIDTNVNYAWTGIEWDPFGSSATEIVNDLTTGGITVALSAEQGKVIKGLIDTVNTNITSEINRAKSSEKTNSDNISDLTTKVTTNTTNISSLQTDLNTEATRAKAAEKVNSDNISTLNTSLSSEITRATAAETTNSNLIAQEIERAKAAEDEIRQGVSSGSTADGGDIPIMPLYREAEMLYTKVNENFTGNLAVYITSYSKPYVNKPFNRIKMMIGTPGKCRISIFNGNIFKPYPTEENSLVKDLVNVQCNATGYHYWDLDEDVIIEEGQYIGAWFTSECARYIYSSGLTYLTGYPSGWQTRYDTSSNEISKETLENTKSTGYLNIGLYKRGSLSDFEWGKIDESANFSSSLANSYAYYDQSKLVGKTFYKFKINVKTPGYFTVYVIDNYNKSNASIAKSWKLYIRQPGIQTVRLPEDVVLQQGQGFAFCSEDDTCIWYYGGTNFGTKYALNKFIQYTNFNLNNQSINNNSRLNIGLIERGGKITTLEDKTISIQGDSISTFEGSVSDGNAIYYSTTHRFVNNKDTTWWGLLTNECRMRLIANDAWSGSRISDTGDSAMKSATRCSKLKNVNNDVDTIPLACPEILVVMAGTNDVGGGVSLETYKADFTTMLQNLKKQMPHTKIIVFQLYRGNVVNYRSSTTTPYQYEYQEAMETICRRNGAFYIGPERFNFDYNTMKYVTCDANMTEYGAPSTSSADYLHPNTQGMERIYAGVRSFLEALY